MRLLLDENISPRLISLLADIFPDSEHVEYAGLGGADDATIWLYAKLKGLAIVSKDSDFAERSVLEEAAPKIVWIRLGNCSTQDVVALIRLHHRAIVRFLEAEMETCLVLGEW